MDGEVYRGDDGDDGRLPGFGYRDPADRDDPFGREVPLPGGVRAPSAAAGGLGPAAAAWGAPPVWGDDEPAVPGRSGRDDSVIPAGGSSVPATAPADTAPGGHPWTSGEEPSYLGSYPAAGGYPAAADAAATGRSVAPPASWVAGRDTSDDSAARRPSWRRRSRHDRRQQLPVWQELPLLLVVAFCLAVLIRTFLLQAFFIPSSSMEDTLLRGDRVLVNKIVYDVRQPKRGEVIVFKGSEDWAPESPPETNDGLMVRIGRTMGDLVGMSRPGEKDFIKRVIGVPGDRVSCCDSAGRVYVNGKGLDEPYVTTNSPLDVPPDDQVCRSRRFAEVLVPPGQLFVMGDHRIVSQDSRCQGTVPVEDVIGRAFLIVWPSGRWDTLAVPETFHDVPGPVALRPGAGPAGPAPVDGSNAVAISLLVLAAHVASVRSGRKRRWGRRTLPR